MIKKETFKKRSEPLDWYEVLERIVFVSSLLAGFGYLAFALLSWTNFPGLYSPLQNWLSDLGSSSLNPGGALYYNLGVTLAGLALLPFFFGLSSWAIPGNRIQNTMLTITVVIGSLGALAMVMSAFFPITVAGVHSLCSAALYILLGTSFVFSAAALRYYPHFPRWLLALALFIALEDMLWGTVLNVTVFEWITVALFFLYILLLGWTTRQRGSISGQRSL